MILTDIEFWYVFFNSTDKHHQKSVDVMRNLDEELITTWLVITETSYLLGKALGAPIQLRFLSALESVYIKISELSIQKLIRIQQLIKKYGDLPINLVDDFASHSCRSTWHGCILSIDMRDFNTYRWKSHKPFQNLLLPDS